MEKGLNNYIEEIKSDISALVYSDGEGVSFEDKFTEYCIEVLDSIGKSEGARVLSYNHPNSNGSIDWKINGYCLKDNYKDENNKTYYETLDLFITSYKSDNYEYNISKDEFTKTINQIKKFLNAALKKQITYLDSSKTELLELINVIEVQGIHFDRINIYALINGNSIHEIEKITIKNFEEIDILVHVWDIKRFFKIKESNSIKEPIEIYFNKYIEDDSVGLQCLKVPSIDAVFDCYLAIIPGYILSKLYKEYSNELLESNVRAFLGQTGKFNKGIRDTIREKPQMFLPYNNGITATAETVETIENNNQLYITKLNDFQIVNGGQTTASLYHTQKKYKDADLGKIFVQMKLTVIRNSEQKNIEVPNISRFANSQNKVSELDLSSNNPYFIKIENLSRKQYVVNPENRNQSILWYFERANGQYKEAKNKLTLSMQKKFSEQNPLKNKFLKSDVAKYINLWELEPHYVSQGAQKNFIHYTKKINDLIKKNKFPRENFYKKLIANAIIFNSVDKLFGRKNVDAIGDTNLKSYTVAYTISFFHFLTENRIDLWKIYEEQKINETILIELKNLLIFTHDYFTNSPGQIGLISEYAKKESTWKILTEKKYNLNFKNIEDSLISIDEVLDRDKEKEADTSEQNDSLFLVSKIRNLGIKYWDGLIKYIETNPIESIEFIKLFDLCKTLKENRNLSKVELYTGEKGIRFIEKNPELEEFITSLSDKEDVIFYDIKATYDKLKLLSKDIWEKSISIGIQTKVWDNLEVQNVKSFYNSLKKNEKIKEQSLIKCYESMKKLSKYGIKIG
jgi:hypothetical protein